MDLCYKIRLRFVCLLFLLIFTLPQALHSPILRADEPLTLIVQLAPGTDPIAFSHDYQLTLLDSIPTLSAYLLQVSAASELDQLAADPRVIAVQQDTAHTAFEAQQQALGANEFEGLQRYFGFGNGDDEDEELTESDQPEKKAKKKKDPFTIDKPNSPEQVLVIQPGQKLEDNWKTWGERKIRLDKAFKYATGASVTVAILDTGAALEHPVLAKRLMAAYDFIDNDTLPNDEPDGIDNDGDGRIDEGSGHGTHIAGIIAMVAPDAKLMPIRVLNSDGGGTLFDIVQGLVYAVEQGAQIINMSFSAVDNSPLLERAVRFALDHDVILVAAAAGEDGYLEFPAAYDDVIAVGATKNNDEVSDFSRSYATEVNVFAPGELIFSTYLAGGYAWWSGTSMAAPFVTGQAALLRERSGCSRACIMALIVKEVNAVRPKLKHVGRINLEKSLKKAKPSDEIVVVTTPLPLSCTEGKPTALTFVYTGGSCADTTNMQNGKFTCSGASGSGTVSIVMQKDVDKIVVTPNTLVPGQRFTIAHKDNHELAADTLIQVGGQILKLQTSCSQPLNVDDIFGSLHLIIFTPKGYKLAAAAKEEGINQLFLPLIEQR